MRGERLEKATPADYQFHSGFFVLLPVYIFLGAWILSLFPNATAFVLWIVFAGSMFVLALSCFVWAKYVPTKFSYIFGAFVWIIAGWIAWHLDLAKL